MTLPSVYHVQNQCVNIRIFGGDDVCAKGRTIILYYFANCDRGNAEGNELNFNIYTKGKKNYIFPKLVHVEATRSCWCV